ncbi:MAG: C_GCAxxG_C_C family protein [Parabacteroides sp.]|nr:C_GCAxxG_C_C family protein [Parabacteroides sp.]MBQ8531560.1 C_GCAxxG_C_C family protein [Parabacteroides sp.]
MKEFDVEERVNQAIQNFKSGYNCAQSVFLAYSDLFNIDFELAKNMSVSFGGGMGRMREVCGSVSAMAMLAGFKYPVPDTSNQEARKRNYAMVQKVANLFKEKNGSIVCHELLSPTDAASTNPSPEIRTKEYYKKRPCVVLVEEAARIAGKMLKGELD